MDGKCSVFVLTKFGMLKTIMDIEPVNEILKDQAVLGQGFNIMHENEPIELQDAFVNVVLPLCFCAN